MANPNIEIWGDPESWIYSKYFYFVGNGDPTKRTEKPKTANFASNRGTLAEGNEQGKTPLNQSIDFTICPCGQDPHFSSLGSIALFRNKQTVAGNKEPYEVISRDAPCNWFLYDGNGIGLSTTYGHQRDRTNSQQRWQPNADLQNNWNGYITPFVYWQLKSILIKIEVGCITGYYGDETPQITWRSLNDWKTNYSSQKIIDIRLIFCGVNGTAGANITYTSSAAMDTGNFGGVGVLDDLSDLSDYAAFGTGRNTEFYMIGHKTYGNYYDTASTFYMTSYNMLSNTVLKALSSSSTEIGWCIWSETPYSDTNYRAIMAMTACFGIPFTDKDKTTFPLDYIDPDLYLPVIDDDGITHGEYTHGDDNADNDIYDADGIRDKSYDPAKPVDPNVYSNTTRFTPFINLATATKRYVLSGANVEQLMRDLWTISDELVHTDPDEPFKDYDQLVLDNFLVSNPIQAIVSLDKFPISSIPTGTQSEPIPLGKTTVQNGAVGRPLERTTIEFNFESVKIWPRFGGSFLDYDPYTHYELYIPFCGTTQINAADILGHRLSVIEIMDFTTGTVTAFIMADELAINSISGSCSINIPLSGTDTVTLNSQINNALINAKSAQMQARTTGTSLGRFGSGIKSIMGWFTNPVGVVEREVSDKWAANMADYNLHHIETPIHLLGSGSPVGMWSLELTCRLMIYYPTGSVMTSARPPALIPEKIAEFGKLKGFATVSPGKVSQFHGYTEGEIKTTGISCTANERKRILTMFAQGVILPQPPQ